MEAVAPQRGSCFQPPCVWDHNNGSPNLKNSPWGKGMFCIKRECPGSLAMTLWEEQERTIFVLFICKKYSIHIQVFFMSLKGNRFHSIISAQGLYFNVTTDGFAFTIKPVLLLTSSFSSKGLHWLDIIFSSKSDCCFPRRKWKDGLAWRNLQGQKIQRGLLCTWVQGRGNDCGAQGRNWVPQLFTLHLPTVIHSSKQS